MPKLEPRQPIHVPFDNQDKYAATGTWIVFHIKSMLDSTRHTRKFSIFDMIFDTICDHFDIDIR